MSFELCIYVFIIHSIYEHFFWLSQTLIYKKTPCIICMSVIQLMESQMTQFIASARGSKLLRYRRMPNDRLLFRISAVHPLNVNSAYVF